MGFSRDVPVDLSPLQKLDQLEVLRITHLQDLGPIGTLIALRSLRIEVTGDCDLSPLSVLSKLQSLTLDHTEIYDLSPLADLTNLVTLVLSEPHEQDRETEHRTHDTSSLSKLSNVEVLVLGELANLSGLKNMPMLRELRFGGKQCNDLSPIADCPMLEQVTIYESSISSLEPLRNLKRLKSLTVGQSPIHDLSPLANLLALEELNIAETNVGELRSLSALTRLQKLNIRATAVSDLSPLYTLYNLQELTLYESSVSGRSVQRLQQALPYLGDENWPTTVVEDALEVGIRRIFETPAHRECGEDILFTTTLFPSGITRLYVYLEIVDRDPIIGHEISRDQVCSLRPEDREDDSVKLEIYYLPEDRDKAQQRANDYGKLLGFESVYERAQPLRDIEHLPAINSAEDEAWRERRLRNPEPMSIADSTQAFLPNTLLERLVEYLEQQFVVPKGPPEDRSWWWGHSTIELFCGDKDHPTTVSFHYIADSKEQDAILDWLQSFFASLDFPYQVRFYRKLNLSSTYYPERSCTSRIAGPKEVLREYNGSQFPMVEGTKYQG